MPAITTAPASRHLCHIVCLSLLLVALSACTKSDENPNLLQGYVEGEFLYMAAPMAGIVESVNVRDGDSVTSGALLFSIDPETAQASVNEARQKLAQGRALLEDAKLGKRPTEINALEAQVKEAEAALVLFVKTFDRQKVLFENHTISAEELDRARSQARQGQQRVTTLKSELETARLGARENQVTAAEANVQALQAAVVEAQWNLDQTTQTAPRDALVFDTYFRPGEFVPAGRPIVSLLPPGQVHVRAFVPEKLVGKLQMGSPAAITVDGVGTPFTGKITFISPKAEFTPPVIYSREMRQKLSFMVEISFPPEQAEKLHPGQPVDIEFQGISP